MTTPTKQEIEQLIAKHQLAPLYSWKWERCGDSHRIVFCDNRWGQLYDRTALFEPGAYQRIQRHLQNMADCVKRSTVPGLICFITDVTPGETCVLEGVSREDLIIRDLDGVERCRITPVQPWNHEALSQLRWPREWENIGVNAFLGDSWIGSSEV